MSRRRVVVLASAVVLLAVGLLALLAVVSVTQTEYGRGKLRNYLARTLASRVQGKLHIGRIGGSLLTGVTTRHNTASPASQAARGVPDAPTIPNAARAAKLPSSAFSAMAAAG